jgi:hypothetical protein
MAFEKNKHCFAKSLQEIVHPLQPAKKKNHPLQPAKKR